MTSLCLILAITALAGWWMLLLALRYWGQTLAINRQLIAERDGLLAEVRAAIKQARQFDVTKPWGLTPDQQQRIIEKETI